MSMSSQFIIFKFIHDVYIRNVDIKINPSYEKHEQQQL